MQVTFSKKYLLLTVLLFITEVLIAVYVHDRFVRPYVGDYLVVMLLYCSVRTFIKTAPWKTGITVLLFAFGIETLQYFNFVEKAGLASSTIAKTVIGYGFEWWDILAYTLGVITILLLTRWNKNK